MYYIAFLVVLSQVISQAWAQGAGGPQTPQPDYRLGPADVISVNVLGVKQFSSSGSAGLVLNVSNSGRIHLPYLGVVTVTGMTAPQLESEIAQKLREQALVKDPQVLVQVADYRAHNVYILGEVMQPGQYLLRDEMYVADLITLGMDFNSVSSNIVYLYRRSSAQPKVESAHTSVADESSLVEATKINIKELLDGTRPELNMKLRSGDILYCPQHQPEYYYVVGDVNRPGAIEIPRGSRVLASQAISLAGGPSGSAKMGKSVLVRYNESGVRQEVAVDFKAILKGQKPDFPVKPDDIIFIPGSQAKTLGHGLLGIVPGIASRALIF